MEKKTTTADLYKFKLNGKLVDFMPFVTMEIGTSGRREEIAMIDKYHSYATVLFVAYKKQKYAVDLAFDALQARLYIDIRQAIIDKDDKPTEAHITSRMQMLDSYKELAQKRAGIDLRLDILYGIFKQASNRREDIKYIYGLESKEE